MLGGERVVLEAGKLGSQSKAPWDTEDVLPENPCGSEDNGEGKKICLPLGLAIHWQLQIMAIFICFLLL